MKVLVKFDDNYADEFDVEGFRIMEKSEWDAYVAALDNVAWPQCVYFGTNEGVEWYSAEDHLNCFTVDSLTVKEASIIETCFGGRFGHFLTIDFEDAHEPRTLY